MKVMRGRSALQAVALFLVAGAAYGGDGEGALYVDKCRAAIGFSGTSEPSATEAMNIGFCFGLMDGLRGANYFLKQADPSLAFCEPAPFDNSDLAKAFVAAAGANLELKSLRGALAAQAALRGAFPCKGKK